MINTWDEIDKRFDAIKDHKPKASKKLKELGEILSSAYMLDAEKASDMWQYLINLNVSDDLKNSKFYIAQVFNKIIDNLSMEDSTIFITMEPERVRLMFLYGYDGETLYSHLSYLIEGFIKLGNNDNAIVVFTYFAEKFGGVDSGTAEIRKGLLRIFTSLRNLISNDLDYKDNILEFYGNFECFESDMLQSYGNVVRILIQDPISINHNDLINLLKECAEWDFDTEFLEFICKNKEQLETHEIITLWENLTDKLDSADLAPYVALFSGRPEYYTDETEIWLSKIIMMSDKLLSKYFDGAYCYPYFKEIFRTWIKEQTWDKMTVYLSKHISGMQEESAFFWLWNQLKDFIEAYFYKPGFDCLDSLGRSYKIIDNNNVDGFAETLAKVSAMTIGTICHEEYYEKVKSFLNKCYGSAELLNSYGFQEETIKKTPVDRFMEFVTSDSKIEEVNKNSDKFKELYHDAYGMNGMFTYELAMNEKIAAIICKKFWRIYDIKKDMIFQCILHQNYNRAVELIDLLIETEKYPNFANMEVNGKWIGYSWEHELKVTVLSLIRETEYGMTRGMSQKEQNYSEIVESCIYLSHRVMPHLTDSSAKEIKAALCKIEASEVKEEAYITELLADVKIFITFPKPRGYGGAQNFNRISSEIRESFDILSKKDRIDVIVQIINMLYEVRDKLKHITFSMWMSQAAFCASEEACLQIYKNNKALFRAWLESTLLRDAIFWLKKIGKIASKTDFNEFFNLLINVYGRAPELLDYYKESDESYEASN
ncbi:MAG: hypothetical protein LUG93_12720 [Lachnospiraceae bacterium]|nr:hypothetical protein [Lachnospiraceae bacterium]